MSAAPLTGSMAAMTTCPACSTVWPSWHELLEIHLLSTRDDRHYALCWVLHQTLVAHRSDWSTASDRTRTLIGRALAQNETGEETYA